MGSNCVKTLTDLTILSLLERYEICYKEMQNIRANLKYVTVLLFG